MILLLSLNPSITESNLVKNVVPILKLPHTRVIVARITFVLTVLLGLRSQVHAQATAMIKFGNSYVNLSKKSVGGPVQPGDTLEIRVNFYVNKAYNSANGAGCMYKAFYLDSIPTNTAILPNSKLMLVSNEGLTLASYSQAADNDAGTYLATNTYGGYQIRINLGSGASEPTGAKYMDSANMQNTGTITGGSTTPLFSAGSIITTAFEVVVTGNYGDTITLGAGKIIYSLNSSGTQDTSLTATKYQILISQPTTLCANGSSTNFAAESGGTFGSGVGRNRSTPPTFLIPGYTYLPNSNTSVSINDGYYAIVNNTSPTSSNYPNALEQPNCGSVTTGPTACVNREFGGFWYIGGDHTGTTGAAGNAPPDSTTNAGYMLVVNADLATSEAYRQVISGLCPNTYYQFSVWIKNICPNCGIDINGNAEYTPGVLPNLTLVVDGLDRISSGQLDTLGWQQRGFTFLTGPTETSITISIRNNAPGGGGNDWAMDDITLATCPPNILLTPDKPDTLCAGADDTVRFAISSYVNNYTQFQLQQSTDGGVTWTIPGNDTLGHAASGSVTPVYNSALGLYVDTVVRYYQIPATAQTIIYRLTVASTTGNLANSGCSYVTTQPKTVVAVNCLIVLPTTLLSFHGQVNGGYGLLSWTSADEVQGLSYSLERSDDGVHFSSIATIAGTAGNGGSGIYQYSDPTPVSAQTYYRINMTAQSFSRYSSLVLLSNGQLGFQVRSALNPFGDHISVELTTPVDGTATLTLMDLYGRVVRKDRQAVSQGLNTVTMYGTSNLPAATYALLIQCNDQVSCEKLVKVNAP
jgi:hypothetical protein